MKPLVIGILLFAIFCFHFKEYFSKTKQERFVDNPNSRHKNLSRFLSRRLLSDINLDVRATLDEKQSNRALRKKRDSSSDVSTENRLLNSTIESVLSQEGLSDISVNRSRDHLEWKIDLHVARRKPDKLTRQLSTSKRFQKTPRKLSTNHEGEVENESHENLGMKLTVEGEGEESNTDLLKAWASVGMFLKSFFEESLVNESSNPNTRITRDENVQTFQMKTDNEKLQLQTNSNKTIRDILLTNAHKNFPMDFQSNPKSTEVADIPGILKAPVENADEIHSVNTSQIIEDGFLEVKQEKSSAPLSDGDGNNEMIHSSNLNGDQLENKSDDLTSSERHANPRIFFEFFNRGSDDFENSQVESNADTRRRESRFIFSLLGFRQTLPLNETDFGSGDNSQDNTAISRIPRIENVKLNENIFSIKESNESKINEYGVPGNASLNETESTRQGKKEARFLFSMLGLGSGDDRALPVTEESGKEYETSQTPPKLETIDTRISALELKSNNKDYESLPNNYSAEIDILERNTTFSDYADLFNQTSQFLVSQYHDFANSTDLNETKGTRSIKEARFFFNIMGFGSGDERALSASVKSSEDYKISTLEDGPYDHTESIHAKLTHDNEDYLERMHDMYSVEVSSEEQVWNFTDHFTDLYEQTTEFPTGVEPHYFEEEMVLQQTITSYGMQTSEPLHPTKKISPRFFSGIFSAESGDGDLISRRSPENETLQPLLVELNYIEEKIDSVYGSNLISETTTGNLLTSRPETLLTSVPNLEGTLNSKDDTLRSIEHTPSETGGDKQSDSSLEDFYLTEYREISNTSHDSNVAHDLIASTEHDSRIFDEQLLFGRVAFSSGDGGEPKPVTEEAVNKTSPRERGARFLDDCYDDDCLESVRIHENKSDPTEISERSSVTTVISKGEGTQLVAQGNRSFVDVTESNLPTTVGKPFEKRVTRIPLENEGTGYYSKTHNQDNRYSSSAGVTVKNSEEPTVPELRNLNFTTDFPIDLLTNIKLRPSSGATVPPNQKDCKDSRDCNGELNERCVHDQEGLVCDCGRSFVRHPISKRCEAKTMVEASLRFPAESYHEDLEDPQSERYKKTKKAAEDMMKTLLQVNDELASTVADVEVVGFKPGSLIIIWNFIIPTKVNESLNLIMKKVDHGLNETLHDTSVLKKLPFNAADIYIFKVHQSAIDPCKFSSLNYCGEYSICTRDSSAIRGFSCKCEDGFVDLSEDVNYPGEICRATCIPGYCGQHGSCVITEEKTLRCNCKDWFLGKKCQISGVVMVGSASTTVILVFMLICVLCLVCKYKRSSTYGSDVEERFQRTEEYGLSRKGAKNLGDILPMEESRAVPSGFRYVGTTPNPTKLLTPEVPKITVTSPTVSDMSTYDFSDSTFDSMKS